MKILDLINIFKTEENYINNSLYLKSSNNEGCIYKFLVNNRGFAIRREFFVELNSEESELNFEDKTVINYIEVYPAE